MKKMEMSLNILSGRESKNIDSTENVKNFEKIGKGATFFFQFYYIRALEKFSFFA